MCFLDLFWDDLFFDLSHVPEMFFLGEPSATRILLDKTDGFRTFTFFEKDVFSLTQFSKYMNV